MNRQELENKILELVSTSYGRDISEININTSFKDDLQGASIKMVGLASEIENELDVTVTLQEVSSCVTIKDLIDKIEKELK